MTERPDPKHIVLVIEDEEPIRRILRAGLEGHGYRYFEAATGSDGITQAATRAPDVVLLDLGLPDADGLVVMRRIREWSSVPIVVLTARDQEGEKVRALDGGADDYVTKPFSMPELLARVRVALRHKLEDDSARPHLLLTELGVGYRMAEDESR